MAKKLPKKQFKNGRFLSAERKQKIFDQFEKMLLNVDPGQVDELTREYLVFRCELSGDNLDQFKRNYSGAGFLEIMKRFDRNHPDFYKKKYNLVHVNKNSMNYDLHRDMVLLATALASKIYARILGGEPDDYDAEKARAEKKLEECRRVAEKYGYVLVKKKDPLPERYPWEETTGAIYPV